MEKCIYCGKSTTPRGKYTLKIDVKPDKHGHLNDKVYACCDDCTEKSRVYLASFAKYKMVFGLLCVLALVGTLIFSAFVQDAILSAVCMFILSLVVIVLPFGTPGSIKLYGIKKMKLLARTAGIVFAACGIVTILMQS